MINHYLTLKTTKYHSKDILESYKDNTIKFYLYILKNMESLEKNAGILTKDFIKKLVNREKELENTIFELGEQIKALKSSENNKENDIPKGYNIFMKMIKYASVSLSLGDNYDNMPTLSISDCPLMPDEIEYVNRLISERENELTTGFMGKIGSISIDNVDIGIGGSPRWQDNLADDRAWP